MATDDPSPLERGRTPLELSLAVDRDASSDARAWLPSRPFLLDWAVRALESRLDPPTPAGRGSVAEPSIPATGHAAPVPSVARNVSDNLPGTRYELSVRLVSAVTMRALNREWRGRDRATNVLSFPAGLPALPLEGGGAVHVLGDIALCPEVIAREAHEQGKSPEAHWAHLVVHGVLHLRGLDHEEEGEAAAMEALESRLLSMRDIPDPYGVRVDARPADRVPPSPPPP